MACADQSSTPTNTPILDSGAMPPRVRRKSIKGTIIGVITGLFIGLLLTKADRNSPDSLDPGYGLIFLFLAAILATSIHEVGHLLAGWAVGFRFSFIQVGPVSLGRRHGRLQVRVRREMSALGYAGMHVDRVCRLRRRLLIYIASGPAANLLSLPATVILVNYVFPSLGESWFATPAAEFAFISLLFAMISLVPFSPNLSSDGARIRMLLTSKAQAWRWISIASVGRMASDGVRARQWKQTWLASAIGLRDMTLDEFHGNWLAYSSASDRKDAVVAASRLERCLELANKLLPSLRDSLAQEAGVFCSWFRGDLSLSKKWLAQVKRPKSLPPLLRFRITTALSCAKHDFGGALASWQQGIAFIEGLPPGPRQKALWESWQEWRNEIEKRRTDHAPVPTQVS